MFSFKNMFLLSTIENRVRQNRKILFFLQSKNYFEKKSEIFFGNFQKKSKIFFRSQKNKIFRFCLTRFSIVLSKNIFLKENIFLKVQTEKFACALLQDFGKVMGCHQLAQYTIVRSKVTARITTDPLISVQYLWSLIFLSLNCQNRSETTLERLS